MKNIKAPKLVTIAILSLITAVFWVGFEIFRAFTVKPEPPVEATIISPINPTLDVATLSSLQDKVFFEESQISEIVVATPIPIPEATPIPTVEPTPTPEESTASGEVAL